MNISKFQEKIVVNQNKTEEKWYTKCKLFFEKWNRHIATVLAVLVFVSLVGVVIYDIVASTSSSYADTTENEILRSSNLQEGCSLVNGEACNVFCENLTRNDSIESYLNSLLEPSCTRSSLKIQSTSMNNNKIPAGWLSNLTTQVSISILSIIGCNIVDIEDGAFNSFPFRLERLTIEDTEIGYLRKKSFLGTYLNSFQFRFVRPTRLIIEDGLLEHMRGSLDTLQFNFCTLDPEAIRNLTRANGVYLQQLVTIDFRFNDIRELPAFAFENAPSVVQIFLTRSSLQSIHVNAFRGLHNLQLLHLEQNFLSTLEEGTVTNNMMSRESNIFLHANRWNCNCKLQWLKEIYLNYNIINNTFPPVCHSHGDRLFNEVEFCKELENVTTETTTSTTGANITTEPEPRYVQVTCRDLDASPIAVPEGVQRDFIYTQILNLMGVDVQFDVFEIDQEPVLLEVVISEDVSGYHLLWFNSYNHSEYGCVSNMLDVVILEGLKRNHTYTICLIYGAEATVSPFNCFGLRIRVEWPYRCFIINKWLEITIGVSTAILLTSCALSACIMFYCVRQNPSLIKGNKRVIIVGRQTADAIVMPKEYDRPTYVAPSMDSYAPGSYLTPNYHQYTRVRYNYRPPILRSVSEESVLSNNVSYVNPLEPTEFQLSTWRKNARHRPRLDEFVRNQNDYEVPPALPPLNKSYNKKNLPVEENTYSSV